MIYWWKNCFKINCDEKYFYYY